ncbi:hypothetical protein FACS1894217_14690 [Clostridia bacterium]|nr:hypothetical protein FACS1894217_14690 [Clostridia bacterium]
MSKETDVILRGLLYSAKKAKTLEEVIDAIEVVSDPVDVVAVVEKKLKAEADRNK